MDDQGFREFVEARYSDLLRIGFLLTGSSHAAEDLVQSALLGAARRFASLDDPMAYVRRSMVNQHTSVWRRFGRREVLTAVMPEKLSTVDQAEAVESRRELLAALATLPARMRAVLVLRYWEDLSEIETAAILACSVGTVKSQASRGLARLRDVLDPKPVPRTVEVTA